MKRKCWGGKEVHSSGRRQGKVSAVHADKLRCVCCVKVGAASNIWHHWWPCGNVTDGREFRMTGPFLAPLNILSASCWRFKWGILVKQSPVHCIFSVVAILHVSELYHQYSLRNLSVFISKLNIRKLVTFWKYLKIGMLTLEVLKRVMNYT